jgi:cell division protein FtsB
VTPLESLNSESAVLIKKISDLTIENQNLKAEVSQLRDKFEQIKKLAS